MTAMIDLKLRDRKSSLLVQKFDGNLYSLCDYDGKGILVDILAKFGEKRLTRELKLLVPCLYCNGKGITVKEAFLMAPDEQRRDHLANLFKLSDPTPVKDEHRVDVEATDETRSRKICWKLPLRGLYGETLLHILIICNTKTHTSIAKCLITKYPASVFDVFESEEYFGASALHLSIAYKNEELTELLLKAGADVNQRATGNFFLPTDQQNGKLHHRPSSFVGLCYLGEYPLAWAASVDDKRMYNALLSHGADPNLQDTFGNMVLHVIVAKERQMLYSYALKHPVRAARADLRNVNGHTPLGLACLLGRDVVFAEIIELKCFEFWTYSIITCCGYPLDLIDSIQLINTKSGMSVETDPQSALTMISEGKTDNHIDMLKGGIVQKLLEEKWKTFGYIKFTRSLMRTFVYLFILSIAVFLRSVKQANACPESTAIFVIRSIAEILTLLACGKLLADHGIEIKTKGMRGYLTDLRKRASLLIFTISNIFIIFSQVLRICGLGREEDVFIAVALPISWFFLIFFAGGFKLTGPFVSMIRYMLVQDMRQFSIIYLVFLYGFSQAFYFLLKDPLRLKPRNHASYEKSWMELFRMTLGAHEYEELRSSYYHWMTQFFFVLFLILVPILLLNMLIAMMGNTYSQLITQSEREWTIQWANILVEIERALPKKEATMYIDQYAINLSNQASDAKPNSTLMVIKRMAKSKAKQRLEALANWKRLRWKMRTFLKSQQQQ